MAVPPHVRLREIDSNPCSNAVPAENAELKLVDDIMDGEVSVPNAQQYPSTLQSNFSNVQQFFDQHELSSLRSER